MTDSTLPSNRLIVPGLRRLYDTLHEGVETLLRCVAGLALITHGGPKIVDPFGATGMVEEIGFYPGTFWSPLLSVTEFFCGILITLGFLTRPAAIAATVILLVTVYFHWIVVAQGYSGAEKSILWATIFIYFAIRGGNRHSVDGRLGREF